MWKRAQFSTCTLSETRGILCALRMCGTHKASHTAHKYEISYLSHLLVLECLNLQGVKNCMIEYQIQWRKILFGSIMASQTFIHWIKSSPVLKWYVNAVPCWLSNLIKRPSYHEELLPQCVEMIRWVTAEVKRGDDPGSAVSHLSPEISHSSLAALRGRPHLRMMSFKGDSIENYLWKYYIYMDELLCDWQCHLEGVGHCVQSAHTVFTFAHLYRHDPIKILKMTHFT